MMFNYFIRHYEKLFSILWKHIEITAEVLVISTILAIIISFIIIRSKIATQVAIGFFSIIYAIPSLALFALFIPFLGLGSKTAIVVLVLYNQFIMLRGIVTGLASVEFSILETATGLGMSKFQKLVKVQLPLASPVLLANFRIAVVSTIGITTIAATINAGGLGTLLFEGLSTQNTNKMVWGTILVTLLAVFANGILAMVERKAIKLLRG